MSNKLEWNNCFIQNNHQISLKSCHVLFRKILSWTAKRFSSAAIVSLRGKKFQNFSCCADAYTYHICRAWYNGSYTMATKPIKFLELHYTMTQFLINIYIFIYLLKTELRISDFQHFHWLAGHRLSAHIPALPNMVNERVSK